MAGSNKATKMPMIAMTTSSSTSVKARLGVRLASITDLLRKKNETKMRKQKIASQKNSMRLTCLLRHLRLNDPQLNERYDDASFQSAFSESAPLLKHPTSSLSSAPSTAE